MTSPVRELSVVVPAWNEGGRIAGTLERLLEYLDGRFERFEVVVVDDGSDDDTAAIVERAGDARVRLVRQPRRGGKGAAVRRGVRAAEHAWILVADADLAIPIEEVEKLAEHASAAPVVIGSKRVPGHRVEYPFLRRVVGSAGQVLVALCVVRGFHDTQCGFKLYRADVARALFDLQTLDGFGFDFEVLYLARRLGHAVREVPVRCRHLGGGSVRASSYLAVLGEVSRVVWNRLSGRYRT